MTAFDPRHPLGSSSEAQDASTATLKPCPCCKGIARTGFENGFEFSVWHFVECAVCGLRTDQNTSDLDDAVRAWNTRAPEHDLIPRDEVTPLVEALDYVWERIYIGADAKYQVKEPFDLNKVIEALADWQKKRGGQ